MLRLASAFGKFCRRISCRSCGIEMQNKDPKAIGYYQEAKTVAKFNPKIEDIKYLLFSQEIQGLKEATSLSEAGINRKILGDRSCKRCHDALNKNKYAVEDFPGVDFAEIKRYIPKGAHLYHVVPLTDFPLNVDRALARNEEYTNYLILTKSDQVLPQKALLNDPLQKLLGELFKEERVGFRKIVAYSELKNWNVPAVFNLLSKVSYLVGSPNAGKSSLVNGLLRRYSGYRLNAQKEEFKEPASDSAHDRNIHYKQNKAGVSSIPNFTRGIQPYSFRDKKINDLPGYQRTDILAYYSSIMQKPFLERIWKCGYITTAKLLKKRYNSLLGSDTGRCVTIGGLFYLVPPPGSINQVVSYIPGSFHQYRCVDKALEVVPKANAGELPALKRYVEVTDALAHKDAFVRHIIPPFSGSIEVVLKHLGYIRLLTTGKYEFKGLYEIWVPRGIEVCVRKPLGQTIRDHSSPAVGPKPTDGIPVRRLFSSTYPMPHRETDTLSKMKEMYLERTKNDVLSVPSEVHGDIMQLLADRKMASKNMFWHYTWDHM